MSKTIARPLAIGPACGHTDEDDSSAELHCPHCAAGIPLSPIYPDQHNIGPARFPLLESCQNATLTDDAT